jgi:hypothetical protein
MSEGSETKTMRFELSLLGIEKGIDVAADLIKRILGPAADAIGSTLGEKVQTWTKSNRDKVLLKTQKLIDEQDIIVQQISTKVFAQVWEFAGHEDDRDLQDLWANLLANYVDSTKNLTINVYPDILRQLSSNEIWLLLKAQGQHGSFHKAWPEGGKLKRGTDEEVNNLERLGLIEQNISMTVSNKNDNTGTFAPRSGGTPTVKSKKEGYNLTRFCKDFLAACTRENPSTSRE